MFWNSAELVLHKERREYINPVKKDDTPSINKSAHKVAKTVKQK